MDMVMQKECHTDGGTPQWIGRLSWLSHCNVADYCTFEYNAAGVIHIGRCACAPVKLPTIRLRSHIWYVLDAHKQASFWFVDFAFLHDSNVLRTHSKFGYKLLHMFDCSRNGYMAVRFPSPAVGHVCTGAIGDGTRAHAP